MSTVASENNYWIAPSALTISLNALDDPEFTQVTVLAGSVIMVYIPGVINYDAGRNFPKWNLTAYNSNFETTKEKHVYARLERNSTTALIVYSDGLVDIYGVGIGSGGSSAPAQTDYYYVYLGTISSSVNTSGASQQRYWSTPLNTGLLNTSQYFQDETTSEWNKMFRLNKVTNLIEVLKTFSSFIVNKFFLREKEVTDIKRSTDKELISDTSLATSKYVFTEIEKLDDKYLRKDKNDTAIGTITFKKRSIHQDGAQFGESFVPGILTGSGGLIDGKGNAELESAVIRRFLEVPEIRYNRTEVTIGNAWRAPGAGIIESVDTSKQIVTLKLEEKEIGAVAVGDICMGIFHSLESSENATENSDDSKGNFTFAGFFTSYFTITEVIGKNNKQFKYQLRPTSTNWSRSFHPCEAMHFAGYGNFTNPERQTSVYETRTYRRMLWKQNTWEIGAHNIAMQDGDLTNLNIHGLSMEGYSTYLNNVYFTGTIKQVKPDGTPILTANDRGDWKPGKHDYYDRVSHNGGLWLCVNEDGTDTEPAAGNNNWLLQVQPGKDGEDGAAVSNVGQWEEDKYIPYLGLVRIVNATYQCININGTTCSYKVLTDESGNDLTDENDNDLLCDEIDMSDFALIASDGYAGEDGSDGNTYAFIYRSSSDKPARPTGSAIPPSGWSQVPPEVKEGIFLWMSQAIVTEGKPGLWSDPVRLSGLDGKPGEDGKDIEFIYQRTKTVSAPGKPATSQKDDFVPDGWTDNPSGVTAEYLYEWISVRHKKAGVWGEFSVPGVWSKWGEKGQDGDGYEYIYRRTANATAPATPATSQADGHVPAGWSDDPLGVTAALPYEWASTRKKVNGKWGNFSTPGVWAKFGKDGENGKDGVDGKDGNSYIFVYQSAASKPVKPTGTAVPPSGWSQSPPALSEGTHLWMSQAVVTGGKPGVWSDPVRISGLDGKPGKDGKDIEFIYQRTKTMSAPGKPATSQADDFVPAGWADNPAGVTAEYLYEWLSVRHKEAGAWGEFSVPGVWSKWGEKGQDGDGYEYIYRTTANDTAPATPAASQVENYLPEGWTDDPTGVTPTLPYEWTSTRKKVNGRWGNFSVPAVWAKFGKDGEKGDSITHMGDWREDMKVPYLGIVRINNASYLCTNKNGTTCSYMVLTDESGNDLTDENDNDLLSDEIDMTDFTLMAEDGQNGEDGTDIEYIYTLTSGNSRPGTPDTKQQDDYVPAGWTDNPQGISEVKMYEWLSLRHKDKGQWSGFSRPSLWSKWGEKGQDGDGYEYIYQRTANSVTPKTPESKQEEDYVPTGWTDDPMGVSATHIYEWACKRKKTDGQWGEFSKPAVWAKFGQDGKDGKDGVGISLTDVMYAISASNTTPPTSGWQTTTPPWENGKYIWSKTVVTYTTGTKTETKPVCITGGKGSTGSSGKDGIGVKSIVEQYYLSTSPTALAGGSWQATSPVWQNGKYIWTRSVITYTDNSTTTTSAICVTGDKGDSIMHCGNWIEDKFIPYLGVVRIDDASWMCRNQNGTTCSYMILTDESGNDLTDENNYDLLSDEIDMTDFVLVAEDGNEGVGVESITEQYYLSSSATTLTGGAWTASRPSWTNGWYIWKRTIITYTNEDIVITDAICVTGHPGAEGRQGIQGCLINKAEWKLNVQWRNDEALTTGTRYVDIALVRDLTLETGWQAYKCLKTHVSTAANAPGNTAFWEEFPLNVNAIFTSLIIAKDASIDFMQGNQLLIKKEDPVTKKLTVTAGLSGSQEGKKVRIWAGGDNPETANFRVYEDGSGHYAGEIDARSGRIGGFDISSGRIGKEHTEQYSTTGLSLYNDFIRFGDDNKREVRLGTINVLGYEYLGAFIDTYTRQPYPTLPKIGLSFNIQNGEYNHAFSGYGSGTLSGIVEGYKCQTVSPAANTCHVPTLEGGNRILCRFVNSGGSVGFPTLFDVQSALRVGKSTPFTCRITFICTYSTTTGAVLGRNTIVKMTVGGVLKEVMNTNQYPQRLDNNGNYQSGKMDMAVGDIAEFMLVYDGGNYTTSYRAFCLGHRS